MHAGEIDMLHNQRDVHNSNDNNILCIMLAQTILACMVKVTTYCSDSACVHKHPLLSIAMYIIRICMVKGHCTTLPYCNECIVGTYYAGT